jgi:hypothetical protein
MEDHRPGERWSHTTALVRVKLERGIWRRKNARGQWVYEIAFKDASGRQRMKRVELKAARTALAEAHTARARGERPAPKLRSRKRLRRGTRPAKVAGEAPRRTSTATTSTSTFSQVRAGGTGSSAPFPATFRRLSTRAYVPDLMPNPDAQSVRHSRKRRADAAQKT